MTESRIPSGHRRRHRRGRSRGPRPPGNQPLGDAKGEVLSSASTGEISVDAMAAPGEGDSQQQNPQQQQQQHHGKHGRRHHHSRHPSNPAGLEQRCIRQFPRVALMRGREYFRAGYVSDVGQMGEAFSLTVQGRGEIYNVWIDYSKAGAAGSLEARCTCPFYATGGL